MSIITKRGDDGHTDLLFGRRIGKTSPRIVALGSIDELNAALGLARAAGLRNELVPIIDHVQEKLVAAMGQLATLPEDRGRYSYAAVSSEDIEWIEQVAREMEARGVRFTGWARPGAEGAIAAAAMDFARAVARRAERDAWELDQSGGEVSGDVLLFLNRLSDLLWILARVEEQPDGA
jgi:cob(I)alamin adenosyltransferase